MACSKALQLQLNVLFSREEEGNQGPLEKMAHLDLL